MLPPEPEKTIDGSIRKKFSNVTTATISSSATLGLVSLLLVSRFSNFGGYVLPILLTLFCVLPLIIPRYFLLGSVKPNYADMTKRVKDETSLSAYVLYSLQNFGYFYRFFLYILFILSLWASIVTMPLAILSIIVLRSLSGSIVTLLIITATLWIVTIGMHAHLAYLKALMGYSGPMPSFRRLSKEKAYLEGLDEAKLYMVIAQDDIVENNADWFVSFNNSLLTLDKTLQKRKKVQITSLRNIIQMISKIRKIDSYSRHEILIKCFIERLISAVESRKIDEIVSTISGFSENPELAYLRDFDIKDFKRTFRTSIKNVAIRITYLVTTVVGFLLALPRVSEQLQNAISDQWITISVTLLTFASLGLMLVGFSKVSPPNYKMIKILKRKSK